MFPRQLLNVLHTQTFNNSQIIDSFWADINDSIPLFINSVARISSTISLFIKSAGDESSLNLFLHAGTWNGFNANLTSAIYGTPAGISGFKIASTPLFIEGPEGSGDAQSEFPLFTFADNGTQKTGAMNLFLQAIGNLDGSITTDGSISAFLKNGWENLSDGVALFLAGPAGTSGAIPVESSMNLYIARDSESLSMVTPLYIGGPLVSTDEIPLFVEGQQLGRDSINCYTYGIGTQEGTIKIFTRGF